MTNEETIEIIEAARAEVEWEYPMDYAAAFDKAIEALEQEPKWIPVGERLPEPNRLVLCYITTGTTETYFLALWNCIQDAWEEGIGGCRLLERDLGYEVIAWMPLPAPFEPKESDG